MASGGSSTSAEDAAGAEYAGKVFILIDRWHAETTRPGIPGVEPESARR